MRADAAGRKVVAVDATYQSSASGGRDLGRGSEAANTRAREQAEALRRHGSSVRFLGSLLIPSDESSSSSSWPPRARRSSAPRATPSAFDRVAAFQWLEPSRGIDL